MTGEWSHANVGAHDAGDRPIEITLQRAWDALSWRRRAALAWAAARGAAAPVQAPDAAAVEAMKSDDVITAVLSQVADSYPEVCFVFPFFLFFFWPLGTFGACLQDSMQCSILHGTEIYPTELLSDSAAWVARVMQLVGPLLHERDMYLAWSLKRSKAADGTRRVVGIVGKGHVRGVLYHLTHPSASAGLRFRDLVGSKNLRAEARRERRAAAARLALELALAGGTYVAWCRLFP
jgi:pheromone shutdown protein TraB